MDIFPIVLQLILHDKKKSEQNELSNLPFFLCILKYFTKRKFKTRTVLKL